MQWWLPNHRQNQGGDLWQQVSSYFTLYSLSCPHNIRGFPQPHLVEAVNAAVICEAHRWCNCAPHHSQQPILAHTIPSCRWSRAHL